MPSQTFHLKREQIGYLDSVADGDDSLENPSQALKRVIDDHRGVSE